MSMGLPTKACSTALKSVALITRLPLNSNPVITGSLGGAAATATAAAAAVAAGVAVLAGVGLAAWFAAGVAATWALVAVAAGAGVGAGVGAGAAKRTQLIFLSLLSKALGMAGLTGLGGYCTHWS
jgi:hypothetical protein